MKKILPIIMFCIIICISCEESEPKPQELEVSTTKISLNSGYSENIVSISDFDILYESENDFHASVSNLGKVTAVKVGNTTVKVSSNGKSINVLVEVIPLYTTYPTPIIDWNKTRSSIISANGQPDAESGDVIGYEDYSTKAPMVMYMFDSNGKLESTAVMVRSAYSSELGSYIAERYQFVGEQDGIIVSADALEPSKMEMAVAVSLYDLNYWMVMYMPYSSSGLKSSEDIYSIVLKTKEIFRKELK